MGALFCSLGVWGLVKVAFRRGVQSGCDMAGKTYGGASLIDPSEYAQAASQAVPLFGDTVRSLSVRTWRPPAPTEVGFSLAGEPPACRPAGRPSTPKAQTDSNIPPCWRRGWRPACATACGGQACRTTGGGGVDVQDASAAEATDALCRADLRTAGPVLRSSGQMAVSQRFCTD